VASRLTSSELLDRTTDPAHSGFAPLGTTAVTSTWTCSGVPVPGGIGDLVFGIWLWVIRHRLNRGGDRHANNALWRIVMVRTVSHARRRGAPPACPSGYQRS